MTQIFVVSGTSQATPGDWDNANNTAEAVGGGASGAIVFGTGHATGGGAGEWRKGVNITPGATLDYTIGAGGTSVASSSASANGNDGTQVTFEGTAVVAKPGIKGVFGAGSQNGGAGGTGGTGAAGNFDGGRGGNMTGASGSGGSGGGGAAGSTGAGNPGVDSTSTGTAVATAGGSADAGAGGSAGTAGAVGGNGAEWDASHGSGGGGGGAASNSLAATGGGGGSYGGGGAAAKSATLTATSGAGGQGILVLTYTPAVAGITYPRLERGIRGLNRGMMTGSLH